METLPTSEDEGSHVFRGSVDIARGVLGGCPPTNGQLALNFVIIGNEPIACHWGDKPGVMKCRQGPTEICIAPAKSARGVSGTERFSRGKKCRCPPSVHCGFSFVSIRCAIPGDGVTEEPQSGRHYVSPGCSDESDSESSRNPGSLAAT